MTKAKPASRTLGSFNQNQTTGRLKKICQCIVVFLFSDLNDLGKAPTADVGYIFCNVGEEIKETGS
jgi:hypothetical protein